LTANQGRLEAAFGNLNCLARPSRLSALPSISKCHALEVLDDKSAVRWHSYPYRRRVSHSRLETGNFGIYGITATSCRPHPWPPAADSPGAASLPAPLWNVRPMLPL